MLRRSPAGSRSSTSTTPRTRNHLHPLRLRQPQLPEPGDLDRRPELRRLRAGDDRGRRGQPEVRRAVGGDRRPAPARRGRSRSSSRRSPPTGRSSRRRSPASTSCSTTTTATKALRYGVGLDWQPDATTCSSAPRRPGATSTLPFFDDVERRRRDRRSATSRPIAPMSIWTPLAGVGARAPSSSTTASRPSVRYSRSRTWCPRSWRPSACRSASATSIRPASSRASARPTSIRRSTAARAARSTSTRASDDFVVLDAAVGYRLPKRLGIVEPLESTTCFDNGFHYQDDSFREFQDAAVDRPLHSRSG